MNPEKLSVISHKKNEGLNKPGFPIYRSLTSILLVLIVYLMYAQQSEIKNICNYVKFVEFFMNQKILLVSFFHTKNCFLHIFIWSKLKKYVFQPEIC